MGPARPSVLAREKIDLDRDRRAPRSGYIAEEAKRLVAVLTVAARLERSQDRVVRRISDVAEVQGQVDVQAARVLFRRAGRRRAGTQPPTTTTSSRNSPRRWTSSSSTALHASTSVGA